MVFAMLPEDAKKLIQFKNKSNIKKLIAASNLPDYMDGTCDRNYKLSPPECLSFRQLYVGKYSDQELDKMAVYFSGLKQKTVGQNINAQDIVTDYRAQRCIKC